VNNTLQFVVLVRKRRRGGGDEKKETFEFWSGINDNDFEFLSFVKRFLKSEFDYM
jgi:hypothetical protein